MEKAAPGLKTRCHCNRSPTTFTVVRSSRFCSAKNLLNWSAASTRIARIAIVMPAAGAE
jgi:hypothetical protein